MRSSLRLRLALWSGGLTGAVVVIACLYSFSVHGSAHYDQADSGLAEDADHIAGELQTLELAGTSLTAGRERILDAARRMGVVARVMRGGPDGPVIARTPEPMPALQPSDLARENATTVGGAPAPSDPRTEIATARGAFATHRDASGARWRLHAAPVGMRDEWLVVGRSLVVFDANVKQFGRFMALMAVVGTLFSFGAGWLLAGRALRPIAALTASASAIAESRAFAQRLPVGTRRDELGQLAETFNSMLASLELAYAAQQRFVADASHELRAPLSALQANLELLQRHPPLAPFERETAVGEAARETARLVRLVRDLLALARADAGLEIPRAPVEVDRVLLHVVREARRLHNGHVLAVGPIEPAIVEGDANRLHTLWFALLDNALRYTPAEGRVTASLVRDGQCIVGEVRDTGVGIPDADLPHVFERFYRADPARTRDPGGTGLGLSISKWIVDQHGGTIALSSTIGGGTTVRVRLPIADPLSPGLVPCPGSARARA